MEPQLRSDDQGFAHTVGQIVNDVQHLIRQEFALAKTEVKKDWVRGKNAAQLFIGSLLVFMLAGGFALLAFAQGMVAVGIPLGVAYALLSFLLVLGGVASYQLAKRWARSLVMPVETMDALKENVQWLPKQTKFESKSTKPVTA
jgi:hypothetical protein